MDRQDSEWLRLYIEHGDEAAFTALVRRHLDLVFSAALRGTHGDAELARDVAQSVFADLARKSRWLLNRKSLAGWLYTSTHFASSKAVRSAHRRRLREQEAHAMQIAESHNEPDWEALHPVLDTAMHQLPQKEREAVLLRFFQKCELRAVGKALGISEEATRKRVARAIERLRVILARQGITSSAASITAAVSAHAVNGAPLQLAGAIAQSALLNTGTAWTSSWLLKAIMISKPKLILGTALLIGGIGTTLFQWQSIQRLKHDNKVMRDTVAQIESLRSENERLARAQQSPEELERLKKERSELLRLRSQVAELKEQLRTAVAQSTSKDGESPQASNAEEKKEPVETFVANARATLVDGQTLVTGGWKTDEGRRVLVFISVNMSPGGAKNTVEFNSRWTEVPDDLMGNIGLAKLRSEGKESALTESLSRAQADEIVRLLQQTEGVRVLSSPNVTTADNMQAKIDVTEPKEIGGQLYPVGPTVDLTPAVAADRSSVDLTVVAQLNKETQTRGK